MDSTQWAFQWVGKQKWRFYFGIFLSFIIVGLLIAEPFFFRTIIDDVLMTGDYERLVPLLAWAVGLISLQLISKYISILSWEKMTQEAVQSLRRSLFQRIVSQSSVFFRHNSSGDLITRCTGDVDIVRHFLSWVLPNAIESLLMSLSVLTVFIIVDPLYALCLFLITPLAALLGFLMGRKMRPAHGRVSDQRTVLSTTVNEYLNGVRAVKAFTREDYEKYKFTRENDGYKQAQLDVNKMWLRFAPVLESMAQFLNVINLVVGGIMVITGRITLGQMQIFTMLAWALNQPMVQLGVYINDAQRAAVSAERLQKLTYHRIAIQSPEEPLVSSPENVKGAVSFKDVYLRIDGRDILSNINIEIEPGQTIGIMGPTGSGKTTLASLIPRFTDVTKGAVLVDGVNVERYDLLALRAAVGMTMQDVFLFSASVEDNIAYGEPDAEFERIQQMAVAADADEFVSAMPDKYGTIVGERGTGLSGGQKQRISLARALLPNSKILILDDTTSAVDMETEKAIYERLQTLPGNPTKIIIAQRVSSIKHADRIYIMENGSVTEAGTHDELIANKGYYYQTFLLQYGLREGVECNG